MYVIKIACYILLAILQIFIKNRYNQTTNSEVKIFNNSETDVSIIKLNFSLGKVHSSHRGPMEEGIQGAVADGPIEIPATLEAYGLSSSHMGQAEHRNQVTRLAHKTSIQN